MQSNYDASVLATIVDSGAFFFESSPDCVKILDAQGNVLAINENGHCALELEQFSLLKGKSWQSFWPVESHPQIAHAIDTAGAGKTGHFQAFCPTFKGTPKWWDVVVTKIRGAPGVPDHLLAISRDITDSQNAAVQLHTSEQRFRSLITATSAIVWEMTPSGQFDADQPNWSAYTGQTFEQYRGVGWQDAIHIEDRSQSVDRLRRAVEGGHVYQTEQRLRRADGEYRYMSVRAVPIFGVDQIVMEWVGAHFDISARKLVEEELIVHSARQEFQLALADRLHGLSDPAQVTAAAGELLGSKLGLSRVVYAEVHEEQKTVHILHDWTHHDTDSVSGVARQPDEFGPEVIDALRLGEVVAIDNVAAHARTVCQAHAYAHLDIVAHVSIPLIQSGRLSAILSLQCDAPRTWSEEALVLAKDTLERTWSAMQRNHEVARRREAEEALHQSTRNLQFILQSAQIGDWSINLQNGTTTRSLQHDRCFGYSELASEWSYAIFLGHVHPDDRHFVDQEFIGSQATLADWNFECRVIWPDRSIHWIEAHGSVFSVDGNPTSMLGIVLDITARKYAEQELRESAQRKDEFLAMLAHELRNPLAPISAAAKVLQLRASNDPSVRKITEIISRQARHMTTLIDDLLDVSRVTKGLIELDREQLNVTSVVMDAVEQVTPLIQSRHHSLSVQQSPHVALIDGDKKRLVQVIANVLGNSAKYTPPGGEISLTTHVGEIDVRIEVRDNGIGMAPELVERAFNIFEQGKRSSDRSGGGLGLGLALVKRLVDLHHGTVTCTSAGIGQGTKIVISVPRVIEAESSCDMAISDLLPPASEPLRVMVIDDNIDAATTLSMLLETSGYQVSVEHEAITALQRAATLNPDVFLVDIGLPGMSGYELVQLLRQRPQTSAAVFVAVTGYDQPEDRRQILAAGFDHHLVKPVDAVELARILERAAAPQ